jgi:hypothetical protein
MAMATNEDTVLSQYAQGFKANLNMVPQQTVTKTFAAVDGEMSYDTPGMMFNADDVGVSDPEPIVSRVPNTPDKFLAMTRRVGYFQPFHDAAWVDSLDKAREFVDPTAKSMAALMAGRFRYVDNAILAAAVGPAYSLTAQNTAPSSSTLPAAQLIAASDVSYQHDAEVLPTDASDYGLSVAKLLHAGAILDESELEGERYLAFTSSQKADLLRRTPVTSRYYNEVQALNSGKIDEFLGFRIVRVNKKLVPVAYIGHDGVTPVRACVAWIKDAIVYKARTIENATIMRRPDKSNRIQAYYENEHGAVRRYDSAVVQINCYEGAAY